LTDRDAEDMLQQMRGGVLLRGFRGAPPADERALCGMLLRVSALLEACPEILELDINPVMVLRRGVCAVDVRIRIGRRPPAARPRTIPASSPDCSLNPPNLAPASSASDP
jgi:hypothetical protein